MNQLVSTLPCGSHLAQRHGSFEGSSPSGSAAADANVLLLLMMADAKKCNVAKFGCYDACLSWWLIGGEGNLTPIPSRNKDEIHTFLMWPRDAVDTCRYPKPI